MYNVSENYKSDISQTIRNPFHMRVKFAIIDPQAKNDAEVSDTNHAPYSDSNLIKQEDVISVRYDSLEHNQFILDGSKHILNDGTDSLYQGYVSNTISDVNCGFTTPPKLVVNYDAKYQLGGISFTFDEVRNEFASEIRVIAYNDLVSVYDETFTNNVVFFTTDANIPLHNKLEVLFTKTSLPYKRVKVAYIGFGVTKVFTDSIIVEAEHKRKIDLLSTVLPVGDFTFTFLDVNNEYNPENPTGLYQYIEELQPLRFEYGYELNDGTIEWIVGGNNYTTGEVAFNSTKNIPTVTIKSANSLAYLDEPYTKGVYNPSGVTLYNLANSILSDSGFAYEIDASLNSILSYSPIPVDTVRNCLQLIANAGQCILDVDRNGKITIGKFYAFDTLLDSLDSQIIDVVDSALEVLVDDGRQDFKLDKSNSYNVPILSKIPPLRNLITSYSTYKVPASATTLVTSDVNTGGVPVKYTFEYDSATAVSLSAGAGLTVTVPAVYYANNCVVTLNGTGTVTITGKKLEIANTFVTNSYNANGVDCNISNPLVTSVAHANAYANWVGSILNLKNEYAVDNRGYVELDVGDKLGLETQYTFDQNVFLTENIIVYDGGLSGKSKMIIAE